MILKKYKAQGFIEALLAILIGGIAVVALMNVTTRTLGQVAKNEIRDQLTQEAVLGSNMIDYIIEYRNNTDSFPGSVDSGIFQQINATNQSCYELDGTLDDPVLGGFFLCAMNSDDEIRPDQCINSNWSAARIDDQGQPNSKRESLFRIACFGDESLIADVDGALVVFKVFTGTIGCQDMTTWVSDYRSEDDSCIIVDYTSVHPFKLVN